MKTQHAHSHTQNKPKPAPTTRPSGKKATAKASRSSQAPNETNTRNTKRDELDRQRAENEGMGVQKAGTTAPTGNVEGEGSYTAAREYREGIEQSIRRGDTERLAEEAAEALDGPEGRSLRDAEKAGKRSLHH